MPRWATIALCLLTGSLFAWQVPLERLYDALQSIMTVLAIMAAAILVRLNRTMPTVDWKILDKPSREKLTGEVVDLAEEYIWFLAVIGAVIVGVLTLMVVGREEIFGSPKGGVVASKAWYWWWRRTDSAFLGAAATFVSLRMGYLVWRDLDIVRLQKHVIDLGAAQAHKAEQEQLAADKRANMARASLRTISNPPPKAWSE